MDHRIDGVTESVECDSARHELFAFICTRVTDADLVEIAGQGAIREHDFLARLRGHVAARRLPDDEDFDEVEIAYLMMLGPIDVVKALDAFVACLNLNFPVGGGADEAADRAVETLARWCADKPAAQQLLPVFLRWRLPGLEPGLPLAAARIRAFISGPIA